MPRNGKPEIFVSVDVETDGPIPLRNSMLSLGAAAFDIDKNLMAIFHRNLRPLPDASPNPDNLAWWKKQPDAWAATQIDPQEPETAMREWVEWVHGLKERGRVAAMAFPMVFDGAFLRVYGVAFAGEDPFGFSQICLKTLAAGVLKRPIQETDKRHFPRVWHGEHRRYRHVAIHDAVDQGNMGVNIVRASRDLPPIVGYRNLCGYDPDLYRSAAKKRKE